MCFCILLLLLLRIAKKVNDFSYKDFSAKQTKSYVQFEIVCSFFVVVVIVKKNGKVK